MENFGFQLEVFLFPLMDLLFQTKIFLTLSQALMFKAHIVHLLHTRFS